MPRQIVTPVLQYAELFKLAKGIVLKRYSLIFVASWSQDLVNVIYEEYDSEKWHTWHNLSLKNKLQNEDNTGAPKEKGGFKPRSPPSQRWELPSKGAADMGNQTKQLSLPNQVRELLSHPPSSLSIGSQTFTKSCSLPYRWNPCSRLPWFSPAWWIVVLHNNKSYTAICRSCSYEGIVICHRSLNYS